MGDRLTREAIWRYVTPRWQRHLERILEQERDVAAVIVFTVPMAHLRGIPTRLRERFDVPVVFYDGDVPMSLPEFGGMDTGFNYYHGADPSEYDLVLSNSEGGLDRLRELGARRAEAVFWAADPELFQPAAVEKEHDVFFYGYGDKFRREWMKELVGEPSRRDPEIDFALGGTDFRGDIGNARMIGDVPFNVFAQAISRARINLNITRRSHATVYASSTCRPFELAASGAAIVSNPHEGIERWFDVGSELRVVVECRGSPRPHIASCSTIRRRPRRWDAVRASACSTSTPTRTVRGRSSSSWACSPPWPPVAELAQVPVPPRDAVLVQIGELRRIAIVPALNEEETVGRVIDEIHAFDPGFDIVVVDDGSTDRTAGIAADRRCARAPSPVQPRHRRRRSDGLPVRVRARL